MDCIKRYGFVRCRRWLSANNHFHRAQLSRMFGTNYASESPAQHIALHDNSLHRMLFAYRNVFG